MARLMIASWLLLMPAESSTGRSYEEKSKDERKGAGGITVATGKMSIKKRKEVYKVFFSVEVSPSGRNQTGQGVIGLVLLDGKGGPLCLVGPLAGAGGSSGHLTVGVSTEYDLPAREFEAASGYAMILRSEGEWDLDVTEFLKKNAPSWKKVVKAYRSLRAEDGSKPVGLVIIRRLK